ncbi:phospho-2-dehydro-3-deoxyheptonate aldolase [Thermincola ferriacetica]|uniref:Phospho-2-dehydro-3-deoxyheptonate aldolase n=1 Tax=Thermincola ferriacetica TaxID=281456 RepID=A0A0L6W141_9FIRM|nr:3-deoxy-7-phosphoheptulonate synthase [Thermincola ferriacetica]KNZ68794.1 phospho-2-dehydro-3-deoxyheptonate aldolase [Thermincola ferriacetica]
MVVVMNLNVSEKQIQDVKNRLTRLGFKTHLIRGVERIVIGAIGDKKNIDTSTLEMMPGVEKVVHIMQPFKLVSREAKSDDTIIKIKNVEIGGNQVVIMAGPCAVESREQMMAAARAVKEAGARIFRGGAYKPRTSPYSFQGFEEKGLELMAEAAQQENLITITEVIDQQSAELAAQYIDILQIGTRNMQNFQLLKKVGQLKKPVLLKRGLSATIEEWLMAAEYIMAEGNYEVILCERGIRTFETYTRNTLDLTAVPVIKRLSHLPVVVDPSHATGDWKLVAPMAKGAVAVGADGLLIEVHPDPSKALCDGPQSLTPENFKNLVLELEPIAKATGRSLAV